MINARVIIEAADICIDEGLVDKMKNSKNGILSTITKLLDQLINFLVNIPKIIKRFINKTKNENTVSITIKLKSFNEFISTCDDDIYVSTILIKHQELFEEYDNIVDESIQSIIQLNSTCKKVSDVLLKFKLKVSDQENMHTDIKELEQYLSTIDIADISKNIDELNKLFEIKIKDLSNSQTKIKTKDYLNLYESACVTIDRIRKTMSRKWEELNKGIVAVTNELIVVKNYIQRHTVSSMDPESLSEILNKIAFIINICNKSYTKCVSTINSNALLSIEFGCVLGHQKIMDTLKTKYESYKKYAGG